MDDGESGQNAPTETSCVIVWAPIQLSWRWFLVVLVVFVMLVLEFSTPVAVTVARSKTTPRITQTTARTNRKAPGLFEMRSVYTEPIFGRNRHHGSRLRRC